MGRVVSCIGEVCWQISTRILTWCPRDRLSWCPYIPKSVMFFCLFWWGVWLDPLTAVHNMIDIAFTSGGLVDQQREAETAWDPTPPQRGTANILLSCFKMTRGTKPDMWYKQSSASRLSWRHFFFGAICGCSTPPQIMTSYKIQNTEINVI